MALPNEYTFFRRKLLAWAHSNLRHFPWRNTNNPYRVCIAEIMLHQTFARKVVPIYKEFIKRYPNINKLSRANIGYLEKLIYPLGLIYRARTFKKLAQQLKSEHNSRLPKDLKELLSLPGVGNYTASAIMCFAYEQSIPIIDANVIRVYSRFFGIKVKLPSSAPNKAFSEIAEKVLPKKNARLYNYGLLDFAALVCTHYNPKCDMCPVSRKCIY